MNKADFAEMLNFIRSRTTEMIDALAARPDAAAVLAYRPGPGRAPVGWQLMHIGATDDRMLNVRFRKAEPANPDYIRRFAGGSVPDDQTPTIDEIRTYLAERRKAVLAYLAELPDSALPEKANPEVPWTHERSFQVLCWHEAHHHGQAHLALNMYKAAHDAPKA
jgi:uncharacterized damage-inducible protein DinB